jgi:hypothetical protein
MGATTTPLGASAGSYAPIGPEPVVTGGKFTVTNTTVGGARFYELRKP